MQLRYYQQEAVDAVFDYFNDPSRAHTTKKANPLICCPTGTGKSLIIAAIVKKALQIHPGTRIIMSTHIKELIKQNSAKLKEAWPLAPLGVYSAGLDSRDCAHPIIFGGVQSMVKKFPLFGRRDLLIIDEAHLLANEGSYKKFIGELMHGPADTDQRSHNINPYLKVIGLTATPYRMGLGLMTNGDIFTDIVYDLCNIEGFSRLIAEGFLCPLIPPSRMPNGTPLVTFDVSNVGMSTTGDYNQGELQEAVDKETITYAALSQLVELGQNRRSWMLFASGVEHADHISEMLNTVFGIPTVCLHSKKSDKENEEALKAWKTGKVRAAVSMNKLTTGVDHPPLDLIGMLRPTMSPGLWVQMLGRGTRPYDYTKERDPIVRAAFPYVKENCLVLDFAGNIRRLGPINDPVIPKLKGKGPPGDAPVRICGACGAYNHASARSCVVCGTEFLFAEKISRNASNEEFLRSDLPQIESFKVDRVVMVAHKTYKNQHNCIKVAYYCGIRTFYEIINVEASANLWRHKSRDWFRQRFHYSYTNPAWDKDVPFTNNEILAMYNELRWPTSINVWINKPTAEIMSHEFG